MAEKEEKLKQIQEEMELLKQEKLSEAQKQFDQKKQEIQQEKMTYLKQVKNEVRINNSDKKQSEESKDDLEYINMSPEPTEKTEK